MSSLPGALILLPGQLVPPGEQQPEGGELLGVEGSLLPPLELLVRLLCEDGLDVFLEWWVGAEEWVNKRGPTHTDVLGLERYTNSRFDLYHYFLYIRFFTFEKHFIQITLIITFNLM